MSNLIKIGLVVSLPLAAIVVVLLINNRSEQSDPRRQVVQAYVQYRAQSLSDSLTVAQTVQARLPQRFQADMSRFSFGDTPYYQTTQRLNPEYPGQKPLPYPPNDLWCVKVISADPKAPQAVVAALHQDIYNADWVVHEVSNPTVLQKVGCQFADQ